MAWTGVEQVSDSWRERARPIIADVIRCFSPGDDIKVIKKAVMATYPWHPRENWPYKVWCDETRRQLARLRRAPQAPHDTLPLFGGQ